MGGGAPVKNVLAGDDVTLNFRVLIGDGLQVGFQSFAADGGPDIRGAHAQELGPVVNTTFLVSSDHIKRIRLTH